MSRIPEAESIKKEEGTSFIFSIFLQPLKDKNFLKLIFFVSAWMFAIQIAAPFYGVFMIENLKIDFPEKCNGCELCVMVSQRQFKKAGLDGALIRVFREGTSFSIHLDPQVNTLNLEKIKKACPREVFSISEKEDENELLS